MRLSKECGKHTDTTNSIDKSFLTVSLCLRCKEKKVNKIPAKMLIRLSCFMSKYFDGNCKSIEERYESQTYHCNGHKIETHETFSNEIEAIVNTLKCRLRTIWCAHQMVSTFKMVFCPFFNFLPFILDGLIVTICIGQSNRFERI